MFKRFLKIFVFVIEYIFRTVFTIVHSDNILPYIRTYVSKEFVYIAGKP